MCSTSLALNANADRRTRRSGFSPSQTLARPEYRELAPISYRDMLGEREVFGDSSLVRTLVQNYDARWEWYPSFGEVVSVGSSPSTSTSPSSRSTWPPRASPS